MIIARQNSLNQKNKAHRFQASGIIGSGWMKVPRVDILDLLPQTLQKLGFEGYEFGGDG